MTPPTGLSLSSKFSDRPAFVFPSGGLLGVLLITVLGGLLFGSAARAQSNAALLVKPWDADQTLEDHTDAYLFSGGHTNDHESGHDFRLFSVESQGRVRLLPGNVASPRFGYDFTLLDSHTSMRGFPSQLIDASFAGGTFLSQYNGWVTGITLGVGYAGDTPFARGTAWYPRADFVLAKKFSETDAIGIGLDYDGNRTYLPDVPLPGVGYSHQFDPKLQLVFGAPLSSLDWKPIQHLEIKLDYLLFSDLDADVGYEFIPHWTVYGGYQTRRNAFHVAELPDHRRLLFLQRRVEVGVRFQPGKHLAFTLAGGYGFDGEFRSGWDLQRTHRVLRFSDEPYVRAGLELKF